MCVLFQIKYFDLFCHDSVTNSWINWNLLHISKIFMIKWLICWNNDFLKGLSIFYENQVKNWILGSKKPLFILGSQNFCKILKNNEIFPTGTYFWKSKLYVSWKPSRLTFWVFLVEYIPSCSEMNPLGWWGLKQWKILPPVFGHHRFFQSKSGFFCDFLAWA